MLDNSWVIKVEKRLTEIQKDVEYIKEKMPVCEKARIIGMIKVNRWLMSMLLSMSGAIIGAVLAK